MTTVLSDQDERVRGALTRAIAELGHAPTPEALAATVGCSPAGLEAHLRRDGPMLRR